MVYMTEDEPTLTQRNISARIPEELHKELEDLKKTYGIQKSALLRRGLAEQVEELKG